MNIKTVERENHEIFEHIARLNITKPQVPRFYVEESDFWIDNYNHPAYIDAMEVYNHKRMIKAQDTALLLATEIDEEIIKSEKRKPKYRLRQLPNEDIWVNFLYENFTEDSLRTIINESFLTENRIYDIFKVLVSSIFRGGVEISNARIKNAINSQIQLENISIFNMEIVHPLDEYTACVDSRVSWLDWQKISKPEKSEIIALYRIKKIVDNHSQDEVAIEMQKTNKN